MSDVTLPAPAAQVGGHGPGEHPHPSEGHERIYIFIAITLGVLTGIEVGVYYIDWLHDHRIFLVLVLCALAVVKFSLVAGYFMHLKFDNKLFRYFFMTGIALALAVYTIFLLVFGVFISDRGPPGHQRGDQGSGAIVLHVGPRTS